MWTTWFFFFFVYKMIIKLFQEYNNHITIDSRLCFCRSFSTRVETYNWIYRLQVTRQAYLDEFILQNSNHIGVLCHAIHIQYILSAEVWLSETYLYMTVSVSSKQPLEGANQHFAPQKRRVNTEMSKIFILLVQGTIFY